MAGRDADATPALATLALRVSRWQQQHGRHDLPWQGTPDPYRIWLSEIMLQQTQVSTVIPYYLRFIARFPDVATLARAPADDVMQHWAGLGYYARARHLHACAQEVVFQHGGRFPASAAALATLPGIGRSTAAAIAAFAYGERAAILDGNVRRVFCRLFAVHGVPGREPAQSRLWALAQEAVARAPQTLDMRAYTQGLMDLGALVCTRRRPECARCPLQPTCAAYRLGAQDQFPETATRTAVPTRHCILLLLQWRDRILLERRAPHGIWGGLWSLPECADDDALDSALAGVPGLGAGAGDRLEGLTHAFTHFKLQIALHHAVLARTPQRVSSPEEAVCTPHQEWVGLDALDDYGLPAPVRRLLAQYLSRLWQHAGPPDDDECS